jgi:hypothetical protein
MSLFAFRDSISGKFVFQKNYEHILLELNNDPFSIGYIALRNEESISQFSRLYQDQMSAQFKSQIEIVKIEIRRVEYGKCEVYTDSFPPEPTDPDAFDVYKVIE